jgi:FkbM family methyltransferase
MTEGSRLLSTDSEGFQLWETPKGHFWIPPNEKLRIFANQLAEQECKVYGSGEIGAKSGDIVLDCGANVGVYTREALNAGAKLIVAIEPSPRNIKCLNKNFKNEVEQGRVIIYEKGVWNREEILTFYTSDKGSSGADSFVFSYKSSHAVTVPVTTIDKLVQELKLDRVDFIKMDIEGSEENGLIGAKETIAKFGPRIALSLEHINTTEYAEYEKKVMSMVNMIRSFYPNYQTQCGDCGYTDDRYLCPHILFFH